MNCNDAPEYIDFFFSPQEEQANPQSFFIPNWGENFRARIGDIESSAGATRPNFPVNGGLPSYYILDPFNVGATMFGRTVAQESGLNIDFWNNIANSLINKALVIEGIELYLSGGTFPTVGIDGTRTPPLAPINYSVITANHIGDFATKGGALHLNTSGTIIFNPSTTSIEGPNYKAETNFLYGPGTNILISPGTGCFLANAGDWLTVRLKVKKVISAIEALIYSNPDAGDGIAKFLTDIKGDKPNTDYLKVQ